MPSHPACSFTIMANTDCDKMDEILDKGLAQFISQHTTIHPDGRTKIEGEIMSSPFTLAKSFPISDAIEPWDKLHKYLSSLNDLRPIATVNIAGKHADFHVPDLVQFSEKQYSSKDANVTLKSGVLREAVLRYSNKEYGDNELIESRYLLRLKTEEFCPDLYSSSLDTDHMCYEHIRDEKNGLVCHDSVYKQHEELLLDDFNEDPHDAIIDRRRTNCRACRMNERFRMLNAECKTPRLPKCYATLNVAATSLPGYKVKCDRFRFVPNAGKVVLEYLKKASPSVKFELFENIEKCNVQVCNQENTANALYQEKYHLSDKNRQQTQESDIFFHIEKESDFIEDAEELYNDS
eukprot:Nk52_evm34s2209 gene=Nk52_evmTU34s2209